MGKKFQDPLTGLFVKTNKVYGPNSKISKFVSEANFGAEVYWHEFEFGRDSIVRSWIRKHEDGEREARERQVFYGSFRFDNKGKVSGSVSTLLDGSYLPAVTETRRETRDNGDGTYTQVDAPYTTSSYQSVHAYKHFPPKVFKNPSQFLSAATSAQEVAHFSTHPFDVTAGASTSEAVLFPYDTKKIFRGSWGEFIFSSGTA